ncbi:MAG: hypothetical protein ACKVT2_19635 [Saprospiraceae bacterium]
MLEALKTELNELIEKGDFDGVFLLLKNRLLPESTPMKDARQLKTRYTFTKDAYKDGRIPFGENALVHSQVSSALYDLVENISINDLKPDPAKNSTLAPRLGFHHQYTCNRGDQYEPFHKLLEKKPEERPRQHFFYLYGGEGQAHSGIFQRFVNRLKGIDRDYLKVKQPSGFQVCDFFVPVPCMEDVECLKTELPRLILLELEVNDKAMEQVEEKNLAFGLKRCPQLANFQKNDKICFHISITQAVWDKKVVPDLALNFIENFCKADLPVDAPELFFFFSVEYDDDNQEIKKEIDVALRAAKHLISLGELKMVTYDHVNEWFTEYRMFWDDPDDRNAVKASHFEKSAAPLTMVKVQKKLKSVINEINIDEKYEHRNS